MDFETKFPFSELNAWYTLHGRTHLPWRNYDFNETDLGYRVWLAEIMLQQTQADRVKEYFNTILRVFPSIEYLAEASYEEFFPYYKGLGYYSRARNMLECAKIVTERYGGIFPKNSKQLLELPGIGPYTTGAIRAFAYNIPTLSFDTNLEKIFSRYYFGNKYIRLSNTQKETILQDFKDTGFAARNINNALMDYGATISLNTISAIDWENYPLKQSKFYETRGSLEPKKEKKKSTFPTKKAHIIAIVHENHKKYFSAWRTQGLPLQKIPRDELGVHPDSFLPFYIGKNTGNPRSMIQQYFMGKYGLELSVRPPEIKSFTSHGEIPYMICYAQIQSGNHDFRVFENVKIRGFEEGFVEEMEFGESLSLF